MTDGAAIVANGKRLGLYDASGTQVHFIVQGDNNFLLQSTNAAGESRPIFGIQARSSTSVLNIVVPTAWNAGTYIRTTPSTVVAAGTVIGTATDLLVNINIVATATAGVSDGVRLAPILGFEQTVINTSGATIKVYPNNSGSSQIDLGGVNVASTVLNNKSKTFVFIGSTDFSTIAAT